MALEARLPAVHRHLRTLEIASDVYLVRWLLTMFSQVWVRVRVRVRVKG